MRCHKDRWQPGSLVRICIGILVVAPWPICCVRGFAPAKASSNAALEAIGKVKANMNRNQIRTMDILRDIDEGLKGIVLANANAKAAAAASQKDMRQEKMGTKLAGPEPSPTPPTLKKLPPKRSFAGPSNRQPTFCEPKSTPSLPKPAPITPRLQQLKPDPFDVSLQPPKQPQPPKQTQLSLSNQPPTQLQPPRTSQISPSRSEPKLMALQPDLPFQNFRDNRQNSPTSITDSVSGLVSLPPDQPFMNSGQRQQLSQQRRQVYQPKTTMGPDQPVSCTVGRTQPNLNQSILTPRVGVVGLQPDEPFSYLSQQLQQSRHPVRAQQQAPQVPGEPKIVAFRPDQLL